VARLSSFDQAFEATFDTCGSIIPREFFAVSRVRGYGHRAPVAV